MPKVTATIRQKNDAQRYSIFVDGQFGFALSDLELSNSGLREGQELSDDEIAIWKDRATSNKAYNKALNYLSFRPRSSKEVRDCLRQKQFDDFAVDAAILRLHELKLVNDTDFAASWVDNRQLLKPRSKRRLVMELRQKGLGETEIEHATDGMDERAALITVATKKLSRYKDTQRLINYLVGQGFGYTLVQDVLSELGATGNKKPIS